MKIKKGDSVVILRGKDAGKSGKVLRVLAKKNLGLVEGINKFKKHVKKQGQDQPGGIVEVERAMDLSKMRRIDEEGDKKKTKGEKIKK